MTGAALAQVVIAFTGLTAVFLTQTPRWARWACWFGLAGEPAWFYSSMSAHQWGIFTLAFFYTFAWGKGVWTYWWNPWRAKPCDCRECRYAVSQGQKPYKQKVT